MYRDLTAKPAGTRHESSGSQPDDIFRNLEFREGVDVLHQPRPGTYNTRQALEHVLPAKLIQNTNESPRFFRDESHLFFFTFSLLFLWLIHTVIGSLVNRSINPAFSFSIEQAILHYWRKFQETFTFCVQRYM